MSESERTARALATASSLIWISAIVQGIPDIVSLFPSIGATTDAKVWNVATFVLFLGVFGLLATRITRGKRWARVVLLVLFLWLQLAMWPEIPYAMEHGMTAWRIFAVGMQEVALVALLVALVLTFAGPGRAHFAKA